MKRYLTVHCCESDCDEVRVFQYPNKRDYSEGYKRHTGIWKCARHYKPERVLSIDNPTMRTEIVAAKSDRYLDLEELFWHGDCFTSGYVHGVGWNAFADDFPPGTKIIVEATLVLPREGSQGETADGLVRVV